MRFSWSHPSQFPSPPLPPPLVLPKWWLKTEDWGWPSTFDALFMKCQLSNRSAVWTWPWMQQGLEFSPQEEEENISSLEWWWSSSSESNKQWFVIVVACFLFHPVNQINHNQWMEDHQWMNCHTTTPIVYCPVQLNEKSQEEDARCHAVEDDTPNKRRGWGWWRRWMWVSRKRRMNSIPCCCSCCCWCYGQDKDTQCK